MASNKGIFNIGAVYGLGNEASALVAVEVLDDSQTFNLSRRAGIREIQVIRTLAPGSSIYALVDAAVDLAEELGPGAHVVANSAGSQELVDQWRDAYRPLPGEERGRLAHRPLLVSVTPGDTGLSADSGLYAITSAELTLALTERVRTKGFTYPAGLEGMADVLREAAQVQTAETPTGKLKFAPHQPTSRLTALALALYPRFSPPHYGRRYRVFGQTFDNFTSAKNRLGSAALSGHSG